MASPKSRGGVAVVGVLVVLMFIGYVTEDDTESPGNQQALATASDPPEAPAPSPTIDWSAEAKREAEKEEACSDWRDRVWDTTSGRTGFNTTPKTVDEFTQLRARLDRVADTKPAGCEPNWKSEAAYDLLCDAWKGTTRIIDRAALDRLADGTTRVPADKVETVNRKLKKAHHAIVRVKPEFCDTSTPEVTQVEAERVYTPPPAPGDGDNGGSSGSGGGDSDSPINAGCGWSWRGGFGCGIGLG